MASGKELRTKIKSVENTKKITKAMEMISVSKMRKVTVLYKFWVTSYLKLGKNI